MKEPGLLHPMGHTASNTASSQVPHHHIGAEGNDAMNCRDHSHYQINTAP
jgi:hypothetical protein